MERQNNSNRDERFRSNRESSGQTDASGKADATGKADASGKTAKVDKAQDTRDDVMSNGIDDSNESAVSDNMTTPNESEDELLDPLMIAISELAAINDRYVRLQAEWDNFRKRTATERNNERRLASANLIERLLPVLDDLERAIVHSQSASVESLVEGIIAVNNKLNDTLAYEGLEAIDPIDEAFDANQHQAVAHVEDKSVDNETVVQVYQKGYKIAGRVLRTAMVVVATGGPIRELPDATEIDSETDADELGEVDADELEA